MSREHDYGYRISRRKMLGGFAASVAATALPGLGTSVAAAATNATADQASLVVGYLYVNGNTASTNTIAGFARHANGSLSPLDGSPFAIGGAGNGGALPSQGALAVSADRRYLLAVDAGSNQISVAQVGAGGVVRPVSGGLVSSNGSKPVSIAVHGNLVYVANAGTGGASYTGFVLGGGGRLTPISQSTVRVPDGADIGQVLLDASGRHLVGIRVTTSLIDSFIVGADGRLTKAPGSPFEAQAAGPFGSTFRADTSPVQLLVSNAHAGPGQGSVSTFQVSGDGTLTPLPGSPYPNGQTATCWVTLSPDRRYLYTANTGSSTISSYRVASSGALSLVGSTALHGGSGLGIFDLGVDPTGRYVYELEGGARKIAALTASGGRLAELASSPFALPASSSPWGIVIV